MKQIYLIEASFGSYDSYHTRLIKCFEDEGEANAYRKKFERIITDVSDFCAKHWNIVCETEYKNNDAYKECLSHNIWVKYHMNFDEFNGVDVRIMDMVPRKRDVNLKILLDEEN